jgi:signal transduction histidine kinase
VGYFTLDRAGLVAEANLTGAALLGKNRASLIGQSLTTSIAAADRDRWQQHLNSALQSDSPGRIELMLLSAESRPFDGQIDTLRMQRGEGEASMRIALTDITERLRAEMDRRIAITTVSANEAERLRLARELHDDIGQQLSALKMDLSGLQLSTASTPADHRISEMKKSIDASLATVRRITTELRPLLLDDLGLDAALDWLASESARKSGLPVTVSLEGSESKLDHAQALGLFRMAQAALKDVLIHTRGQGAHIELRRRGGCVILVVEAQGSGWPTAPLFSPPDADLTLQQQAHLLGGELIIDSGPGSGRKVTFRLSEA